MSAVARNKHSDDALMPLIADVEQRLADFYGFEVQAKAAAHLVTREELRAHLGEAIEHHPEWSARAAVWLVEQQPAAKTLPPSGETDEVFIGVHLSDELTSRLIVQDPHRRLDDANLDAFCILVEELSHFHLIINRAADQRSVSKLELECQGEIDKLLIAALFLEQQAGDPHLLPLAHRLFDTAIITAANGQLYEEATRYAARFWFQAARTGTGLGHQLRSFLEHFYRVPWAQKWASLERR